ncbi:MAG: DUF4390 domain-containing protein [Gemmatimonadales bacterium]
MRRIAWIAGLCVVLLAPAAWAQDARVALAVALTPDTTNNGARQAILHTDHLLDDPRIETMLSSEFPIRLHYRLELWRSRAWFDAFERSVEWDVVIRHEPLLDQYTVATVDVRQTRIDHYADRAALAAGLRRLTRIAIQPTAGGQYYYAVALDISTLSDTDIKELEQFLQGDVGPAATGTEDVGSAVGRGVRRILLQVAGLPSLRLEKQSAQFRVH